MTIFGLACAAVLAGLILAWWAFGLLMPLMYLMGVPV